MRYAWATAVAAVLVSAGCGSSGGDDPGMGAPDTETAAVVYDADAVGACIGIETGTVSDFEERGEGPDRAVVANGWGGFYDETTRVSFYVLPDADAAATFLEKWRDDLADDAQVRGNAVLVGYTKLNGEDRHLLDTCLQSG